MQSKPVQTKPQSIKTQPWCEFPRSFYSFFKDDFAHEKFFTTKIKAVGSRSTLNLKETIQRKQSGLTVNDQIKFWFDLPTQNALYVKVTSKDSIKIHYDNGLSELRGKKWNFYGSFGSNKALQRINFKIGANNISEHCNSNNRLKLSSQDGSKSYNFYHKTLCTKNKFTFGLLGVLDISNLVIQKNNLLFGYQHNASNNLLLRLQVQNFRRQSIGINDFRSYFDNIIVDYTRKVNDRLKVGVQASLSPQDFKLNDAQLVLEGKTQDGKSLFKGKVNSNVDIIASFKFPIPRYQDIATITGTGCLTKAHKDTRAFTFGFQLDLNV